MEEIRDYGTIEFVFDKYIERLKEKAPDMIPVILYSDVDIIEEHFKPGAITIDEEGRRYYKGQEFEIHREI